MVLLHVLRFNQSLIQKLNFLFLQTIKATTIIYKQKLYIWFSHHHEPSKPSITRHSTCPSKYPNRVTIVFPKNPLSSFAHVHIYTSSAKINARPVTQQTQPYQRVFPSRYIRTRVFPSPVSSSSVWPQAAARASLVGSLLIIFLPARPPGRQDVARYTHR